MRQHNREEREREKLHSKGCNHAEFCVPKAQERKEERKALRGFAVTVTNCYRIIGFFGTVPFSVMLCES